VGVDLEGIGGATHTGCRFTAERNKQTTPECIVRENLAADRVQVSRLRPGALGTLLRCTMLRRPWYSCGAT